MCGINGFNWPDEELVKAMNDTLKHRGPDDEGIFMDKNVSLGHRRLAVIDISERAKQPMHYTRDGKEAIITYNGEVYNFKELKKELMDKGYRFNTNSDTEVILASYIEWGFDCVKRFNGMWAFCIYDRNKNLLFLSRDRFGKKPLYYFFDRKSKKFVFSSELKPLLKHKIKKRISKEGINLYLSLGFIPAPWTVYEGINKLGAGENMILDLKENKLKRYKYYKLPHYEPIYNKKFLIKEITRLIEDSVRIRLIADVPLGAFLSGGLDSSEIVYQMTKLVPRKHINTYSIGFEGKYDETNYINLIKRQLGIKNHHKYFKEADFQNINTNIFYFFY